MEFLLVFPLTSALGRILAFFNVEFVRFDSRTGMSVCLKIFMIREEEDGKFKRRVFSFFFVIKVSFIL